MLCCFQLCFKFKNTFGIFWSVFCGSWWWLWMVFVVWLTDERRLALFLSRDYCQISSPSWIYDTRAGFEPAQNLSSGLVEWSCAVAITAIPWHHLCSSDNHYTTASLVAFSIQKVLYLLLCFQYKKSGDSCCCIFNTGNPVTISVLVLIHKSCDLFLIHKSCDLFLIAKSCDLFLIHKSCDLFLMHKSCDLFLIHKSCDLFLVIYF